MRSSDWSSDVCSSDLMTEIILAALPNLLFGRRVDKTMLYKMSQRSVAPTAALGHLADRWTRPQPARHVFRHADPQRRVPLAADPEIGRAACRARVCKYV